MEAVFRPEITKIYSGGFLPASFLFQLEIIGKNLKKFPPGLLLPQNHWNRPFPD